MISSRRNSAFIGFRQTLALLSSSSRSGWSPTSVIIGNPVLSILGNCSSVRELKQIHSQMLRTGMFHHGFPVSRLLAFCALSENGNLDYAGRIFSQIEFPNSFMWNCLIRGYHREISPLSGFDLFRYMLRENAAADCRTFVFLLKICEVLHQIVGESVHSVICKSGFEHELLVRNSLMHFYVRFGVISKALHLFEGMSEPDVVSWTTIIDGHSQGGFAFKALNFFRRMMLEKTVLPNDVTMIAILSSCSKLKFLNLGRSVHGFAIRSNMNLGTNFFNSLMDMYGKCGSIKYAVQIFSTMKNKDVFSSTTMITAFAKSGNLDPARQLFDKMPKRNSITWSAMIAGYAQSEKHEECLGLFKHMQSLKIDPIEETYLSVLSSCSQSGRLEFGREILRYIKSKNIELTKPLSNAFIDMFAKSGAISDASRIFSAMVERDSISWNSMILGYALNGQTSKALELFEKMKISDHTPDAVTFLGVLSACSHGGLVEEGRKHFREMKTIFSLEPTSEHYACMVDLLGKSGILSEAVDLLESMTDSSREAWGALLHACRIHGEIELGKMAARKLLKIDPNDSGVYTILCGLCAQREEWEEVKKTRKMMRDGGVRKLPGRSLIEVDGGVAEFFAGGKSHPRFGEISRVLDIVYRELGLVGS